MGSIGPADAAPIAQHDGLIWADVQCGGKTLHFVVDTGAGSSCINLATAKRAGIRLGAPLTVAGVGGEATGYLCAGFEGNFGGIALPREVVALDLSGPARGCSEPIDGLIGADFFRGKVVRIDYARGRMTCGDERTAGGIPLRFANGVICAPVSVDGGAARWTRLDTGCTDALDWCEPARARPMGVGRTIALASSRGSALLADVAVGQIELRDVPLKMHARAIFPGEAGLLGNAALSKYRVTIDGIGKRLMLDPAM